MPNFVDNTIDLHQKVKILGLIMNNKLTCGMTRYQKYAETFSMANVTIHTNTNSSEAGHITVPVF
jgi:hypothetical protein